MEILNEIAGKTRLRVERAKELVPLEEMQRKARALVDRSLVDRAPADAPGRAGASELPFHGALRQPGLSFICEVKKASPSRGIIAQAFPWLAIAREYAAAGGAAISVLTEPDYFLGSDQYLKEIAGEVKIPCLRKDFTIDPYQIYEAKVLGAEAVLLICALLDRKTLSNFVKLAAELGLSALVEIHNVVEAEEAVLAGAEIIGINNRDLKTFKVDIGLSAALRGSIPGGILTVAESGVRSPEDIHSLRGFGFDAVLIGESLMRAVDKKKFLAELKAAAREEL